MQPISKAKTGTQEEATVTASTDLYRNILLLTVRRESEKISQAERGREKDVRSQGEREYIGGTKDGSVCRGSFWKR